MKKNILTLFFLLFLPAVSFAQPSIHFNEMVHDFGTVSQEDAVRHVFVFTNTGDQELVVEKVSAS
jgi:hypothetical protein